MVGARVRGRAGCGGRCTIRVAEFSVVWSIHVASNSSCLVMKRSYWFQFAGCICSCRILALALTTSDRRTECALTCAQIAHMRAQCLCRS